MSWLKKIMTCAVSGGLLALSGLPATMAHAASADRVPYDRALIAKLPSTTEDIGLAFLKTANNFPDFAQIVQGTDAYRNMNALAQRDYETRAVGRLQNNYMNFSVKKSDLIVRVKVNTLFQRLDNGEGVLKIRTFPDDPVYFPFYFAKYPIAMIIKDMENFRDIRLSREETDIAYSRLSLSGDATLLLQLYALAADDQKTVMLDDIPQYPFLTEIGYIGLLNNRAEQIWAWKNPTLGTKTSIVQRDLSDLVPDKEMPGRQITAPPRQ